jgi:hypothetical protein
MNFSTLISPYAEQPLSRQLLLDLLKDYRRPNDKLHELVREGALTRLKREVYVPGPKLQMTAPDPFLLANHLYGPSYVSFEAALSHWGLIPEKVYEIASATTGLSKTFKTPAGRYTYRHLPLPYYSVGIRYAPLTSRQAVLIASPEKALWDKIVATPGLSFRSIRQTLDFLTEDMRIEQTTLATLNITQMRTWIEIAPKRDSLNILIKTLNDL